ncbi:uncharacterized protein [Oryza sativa Japonica Group]|uniref:uncharacterized protein isoform X2 n=1 Tax=Oryza sativa subsp. japonica TaxID=39947 RepID=UPI0007755861|nr:uncharacterized protein LOC4329109 isoform X2 [Oryza sativa Japonica Group]KAF2944356.1 hypothetical protein DAI22_02g136300 [Oryza sativa Japonica Group]
MAAAAEAVLFLLHHHLAFFGLRISPSVSVPSPRRRSAGEVALLAVVVVAALLTATTHAASATIESRPADALRSEVDELRLRVLHLESLLEENTKTLKSKANNLEENSNLIGTMEHDIEILMNKYESTKKSQSKSYPESNVKALEDELLWRVVRKMNENADSIESLANGAEKRVESLSSEVKKMEGVIAEQWIQIRQLEQAFVLTKMMTSKVHQRSRLSETAYKWPGKDLVLKYFRNLHGTFLMGVSYTKSCFSHTYKHGRSFIQAMNRPYHEVSRFCKAICGQHIRDVDKPNVFFLGGSISRSCISAPYKQLKIFMLLAQNFHHKVQIFLQDAMRSNSYSRGFATEIITFCLAYFVVISPMWILWFLYSTRFGSKK